MRSLACVMGVASALLGVTAASAQTFDLKADFSETSNPNWLWTFVRSGVPLQKYVHVPGHPLNPAVANGYWGLSNNSQYETSIMKVTADATTVGGTANDFLAGDIILHGANPGNGLFEIRWGGSVRGTATVTGKAWYAHSTVNRVAVFDLRNGPTMLQVDTLSQSTNRSNPVPLNAGGVLTIQAGDTIGLAFKPASGQTYASLAGVEMTINFTPHPCAADLTFGAIAGQPGYGMKNGILDNDDFFYYLAQFASGNLAVADLTTGAIPGQPGYGVPNGVLNNEDFFYYLAIFAAGCP